MSSTLIRIHPDVKPIPRQGPAKSFLRGVQIVVDMLEDMDMDGSTLIWSESIRPAPPRNNVLPVLTGILRRGNADELEGFCAALSSICSEADDNGDQFRMLGGYVRDHEPMPAVSP
jgi:hypothetical protein